MLKLELFYKLEALKLLTLNEETKANIHRIQKQIAALEEFAYR